MERLASLLHALGGGNGAEPQFFDSEQAVIIRIEAEQGMVLGRNAEHLQRELLQSEQQFAAIRQKQVDVVARELHDDVGIFQFGVRMLPGRDFEIQFESGEPDQVTDEIFYIRSDVRNGILRLAHDYPLPPFLFGGVFGAATTGAGGAGMVRFISHCCAIPTKLLVNQYSTSPLDIL